MNDAFRLAASFPRNVSIAKGVMLAALRLKKAASEFAVFDDVVSVASDALTLVASPSYTPPSAEPVSDEKEQEKLLGEVERLVASLPFSTCVAEIVVPVLAAEIIWNAGRRNAVPYVTAWIVSVLEHALGFKTIREE